MTTPHVLTLAAFVLSTWTASAIDSRLADAAQKCVTPEGAETNQPRATPWVSIPPLFSSPERAKQGDAICAALSGLDCFLATLSQGVALGWFVVAPSGRLPRV
ncbi:MAG: hypothetical protein DME22_01210 [Verrucomicrobia bacterium]|nr:MAG: hypothetical protein DME22_01210 [Verrucomicrobiota bacterium]PYJ96915.1 MAG: hypothetical protein DME23_18235 [Verrucomicrobiota bacterium]